MIHNVEQLLDDNDIEFILQLPEVLHAKEKIDTMSNGYVNFMISLPPHIQTKLGDHLGISYTSIPMRWIKGDTKPHMDVGNSHFEKTHLVYLSDNPGKLRIEDKSYKITKGSAFVFEEGMFHETVDTGIEPRLLIGPMNESGISVGAFDISAVGGSTIYIRQHESDIEYSRDNTNWSIVYFPCGINNTDSSSGFVKVIFTTDITFTNTYQFFYCFSDYIQFGSDHLNTDGSRPTIHVNVDSYDGFIDNSTNHSYIYIFNLIVNGGTNTTQADGGWVAKANFGGNNNHIVYCSSIGNIGVNGGGIVGSNAAANEGYLIISGCSSSGEIGYGGGGIAGGNAGNNSYSSGVYIALCWTIGAISGQYAGGIVGQNAFSVFIGGCYSTGTISGDSAGGIIGSNPGLNYGGEFIGSYITACYSRGNISGSNAGGICGSIRSSCSTLIINCYSTGNINSNANAGGITGSFITNDPVYFQANSWYVSGVLNNTSKGFFIGGDTTGDDGSPNFYSEAYHGASGWNDAHAKTVLQYGPSNSPGAGDVWVSLAPNEPYYIIFIGYCPYSNYNISVSSSPGFDLVQYATASVIAGQNTNPAIVSSLSYHILQIKDGDPSAYSTITIDSNTGVISTTESTTAGVYTVLIYNNGYNGSINFSTIQLTVSINVQNVVKMKKTLYSDNARVFYKLHTAGSIGTVNNYRIKSYKT